MVSQLKVKTIIYSAIVHSLRKSALFSGTASDRVIETRLKYIAEYYGIPT